MDGVTHRKVLAGIFVGGASSRMGGRPKGLLRASNGERLVDRWRRFFDAAGVSHVLVGRRAEYAALPGPALEDEPAGIGPLGGLAALLRAAGGGQAIAVACDMPFVTESLLGRLLEHPSEAAALAARRDDRWEPMFARYDAARALPVVARRAEGRSHGLQGVLDELAADELPLLREELLLLRDWDVPGDLEPA